MKYLFLLFSVTALFPVFASAKIVELFRIEGNRAVQVEAYNDLVDELRPGDQLRFTDGNIYTLKAELGHGAGKTTRLFSIFEDEGAALRIPLRSGIFRGTETYQSYISETLEGAPILEKLGVPITSIRGGLRDEYALVDRKPEIITLDDFFRNRELSLEAREKMSTKFIEFAKKTARLYEIGDFHSGQIGYLPQEDRWVLFDWSSAHILAPENDIISKRAPTIFRNKNNRDFWKWAVVECNAWSGNCGPQWIADLLQRADEAIYAERTIFYLTGSKRGRCGALLRAVGNIFR